MSGLAEKLDKDLEMFIKEKMKECQDRPKYCNFEDMTVDEIANELKQHPAFMTEIDESKPLPPALEALQALKYESPSNNENATSYKEDGNKNFGRKKFRWAIDNYTAGLNCKPTDEMLTAILYTNRAAAQFHIGNYRSSLNDSMEVLKTTPNHTKAWSRALKCYVKLGKHSDVVELCDKALSIFPNENEFMDARLKSQQLLKKSDRDARLLKVQERKEMNEKLKIVNAVKARKIKAFSAKRPDYSMKEDEWMEFVNEEYNGASLSLVPHADNESKFSLTWPVLFLYPEHNQSDLIVAFNENSSFKDHLELVFGEGNSPGWDVERKYKFDTIEIFFKETVTQGVHTLHSLNPDVKLIEFLRDKRCKLSSAILTFFLFTKDSTYKETFIQAFHY